MWSIMVCSKLVKKPSKIGILGGCFNPPHKMHLNIALKLIKKSYLDKVIFVPAGNVYNKKGLINIKYRLDMLKIMTKKYPDLEVSNYEQEKSSYTYEVLDHFKKVYPDAEIYFICGSDNLREMKTWKNYEYILNTYKILAIKRGKKTTNSNKNVIFANISSSSLSSTKIRKKLKKSQFSHLFLKNIDKFVLKYIQEKNLYKEEENMERKINKIKLFVNDNEKSRNVAKRLESDLTHYNFELVDEGYDLAISIGGDGSFLKMVNETNFNPNIYYVGINAGTLGFLQEIDIRDCPNFLKRLEENDYKIEEISIGEGVITTEQKKEEFNFLNEIVIRDAKFKVLDALIHVDRQLLENYHGDGILISSSTGSTAYNICYGGSIIDNTLNTLSITPIAPLNNKIYKSLTNSVIIPEYKTIFFTPNTKEQDLFLTIDGNNLEINNCLKIEVKLENRKIKCLKMNDSNFIKTVNNKLIGYN